MINKIANDLHSLLKTKVLKVVGDFMPRGGIAIKPVVVLGDKELAKTLY